MNGTDKLINLNDPSIYYTMKEIIKLHTLKTFCELTNPKPSNVDCKLFNACLMSPEIKSRPSMNDLVSKNGFLQINLYNYILWIIRQLYKFTC